MTVEEKSTEIYDKCFLSHWRMTHESAKALAIIVCGEVVAAFKKWPEPRDITIEREIQFYEQVKQYITDDR